MLLCRIETVVRNAVLVTQYINSLIPLNSHGLHNLVDISEPNSVERNGDLCFVS